MRLYYLQDKINTFLLGLKFRKHYPLKNGEIGINIGCDIETIPSFVGVDGSFLIYLMKNPFLPIGAKRSIYKRTSSANHLSFNTYMQHIKRLRIIHYNTLYGLPFRTNSVNYIFASHFMEHLTEKQGEDLLRECFRVMKPNGSIRIVVPDLDEEVAQIVKKISRYKKDRNAKYLQEYLTINTNKKNEFSFHRKMYNFEEMKRVLAKAKFKNIKRMRRFEGNFPNIKELEVRDGLIVQAIK